MNEETKVKFPALYEVHWPGKPTYTCERHRNMAINLGRAMGYMIGYSLLETDQECTNCINESKKNVKP